jgi:ubiquinone/menaquinone biosynthesis C-methylase UbiE
MKKNSDYYDKLWVNEWNISTDIGPSFKTRCRIINKFIKKYGSKNSLILDCGCGNGDFLSSLENEGYMVSGSDFSEESVKQTKSKIKGEVFKMDLTKNIPNKKYDIIICSEVLEHIENDDLSISNMYKLLNPQGILIISSPFLKKYWSIHDKFSGHIRRYEPFELEQLLIKNHFKILESFGWGNFINRFYYPLLTKQEPVKIMGSDRRFFKKFISKILYYLFYIDDIFKSKKNGVRIYVVAKKN